VPVITLELRACPLKVDISFNTKLYGLENSKLLLYYSQYDHRASKLGILINSWAKDRGLACVRTGGLSPYAWVLTTIFYLQTRNPPVLPIGVDTELLENQNADSIGTLLYGYFRFYAYEFNFYQHLVSIKEGRHPVYKIDRIPLNDRFWNKSYNRLTVEDPVEPGRVYHPKGVDGFYQDQICRELRRAVFILSSGLPLESIFCGTTEVPSLWEFSMNNTPKDMTGSCRLESGYREMDNKIEIASATHPSALTSSATTTRHHVNNEAIKNCDRRYVRFAPRLGTK